MPLLLNLAFAAAVSIQPDAALHHWTRVPIPPGAPLDSETQWSVQPNATLLCTGAKEKGHEWLRYDRELKNFVLHVEWRFRPVAPDAKYNSGIFVRNSHDGAEWWQAQVSGPANAGFFFWDELQNGAKKRITLKPQVPNPNPVRPPGEWNTYEIRAQGPRITLTANGTQTSAFDCPRLTGYLGLEAEHFEIEFRNLTLEELP